MHPSRTYAKLQPCMRRSFAANNKLNKQLNAAKPRTTCTCHTRMRHTLTHAAAKLHKPTTIDLTVDKGIETNAQLRPSTTRRQQIVVTTKGKQTMSQNALFIYIAFEIFVIVIAFIALSNIDKR